MISGDTLIRGLRDLSIVLFLLFFIIFELLNTKELKGNEIFIFIPGTYCLFVSSENNKGHLDLDQYLPCTPFADNRSFDFVHGMFEPIKLYHFDTIGYHTLDIAWKPKYYFLAGNIWQGISFLGMFFIGVVWILSIRIYFKDFGKKRYW